MSTPLGWGLYAWQAGWVFTLRSMDLMARPDAAGAELGRMVEGGFALTASVDILKAIAAGGGPRQGLLALGYAGWGPGQLESEIQHNAWLSVSPDEAILFEDEAQDAKWRRALAKLKVDPLLLVDTAGRA